MLYAGSRIFPTTLPALFFAQAPSDLAAWYFEEVCHIDGARTQPEELICHHDL
jgi:hypothetical protein